MEKNGKRFPSDVIDTIHKQSGLTLENLARDLDCTFGCLLRWRRRQLTLDAVVTLLVFSLDRKLPAAKTLAEYLQQAMGPRVVVSVRRKT